MAARKIVVFLGSTREGRQGEKVARYIVKMLENHGMSVKLLDPLEMNFQVLRQPLHFMKDRSTAPSWMLNANSEIETADGFVAVLAEYNCGVPPALSNMLDHFPPSSFRHRPCSVVTYSMGDFAGVRVGALFLPMLNELGMIPLPARVAVPTVHKKFGDDGQPTDTRFEESVQRMIKELSWYSEALAIHKNTVGNAPK